jgi:hypothetical protein
VLWEPGEAIALRDIWFGRVWRAVAARVVRDEPTQTVCWIPRESESRYPQGDDGRELRIPRPDGYRLAERRPERSALVLLRAGEPFSLWLFRDDAFRYWYVNLERFLARGARTLDYEDHKLDLIVRPDGTVTRKDEDELEHAGRLGLLDADAVRRDADAVLADPPWPTGWEDWRPPSRWDAAVELPPGWDATARGRV